MNASITVPDPYRVLVVDDNADSADTLASVLSLALSCEVYTAYDGRTAVELASEHYPDVVIMDITMPGMDGTETVQVLRKLFSGRRQPKFIAVTGLSAGDNQQRLLSSGFDAFLPKPVNIDLMIGLVADAAGGPSASAAASAPSAAPAY
jgi:CheY-like chemotaxis protein